MVVDFCVTTLGVVVLDPWYRVLEVVAIGMVAGVLGGMLGIGGSVIMIPGLVFLFGQDKTPGMNQHLYQAAAMIANVAIAVPSARRHYKAGAIRWPVLYWMVPSALLFVIIGVMLSNLPVFEGTGGAIWLGRVVATFYIYVIIVNVMQMRNGKREDVDGELRITPARTGVIGAVMGTTAGLMGIGGGVLAVSMQQTLLRLPLRNAIANSAAVMCISALIGCIYKNATLGQHDLAWTDSLAVAALLAPTCILGGHLGAMLTHRMPVRQVRLVFIAILVAAAWRMMEIPLDFWQK